MKCSKIRDIIITDYADNELDEKTRREIEQHLNNCAACRAFEQALLSTVVGPLKNAEVVNPPDVLWSRIKNNLEQGKYNNNFMSFGELLSIFRQRWVNMVFVTAMLLLMALAGNYFAAGIWSAVSQQSTVATAANLEIVDNFQLSAFNDMPNEQVEIVYNDVLGG